jgi:hypothetical protein
MSTATTATAAGFRKASGCETKLRVLAGLADFILRSKGFGRLANIGPLEFCNWTASATYDDFARRARGLVQEPVPPATCSGCKTILVHVPMNF